VAALVALGYGSRFASGKPDPQVLYRWSTAIGGLVQDAVVLVLVLVIAGFSTRLLALRPPRGWPRAVLLAAGAVVAIFIIEGAYVSLVHPGNEQGLTPKHWESAHAAAYVTNAVVICTWVPLVEELTFRGLGYSLLERFGQRSAILGVGVLFGLAHGLVLSLPIIVAFGVLLAWLRARTGSVFTGMLAHATYNAITLVLAVTVTR
jgi:membrane protease YdiL (CAAX protease family)